MPICALNSPLLRKQMQRLAPPLGTGPGDEAMEQGWFRCHLFARAADGRTSRALVSGQGDPANRVTVKCVCESALTLSSALLSSQPRHDCIMANRIAGTIVPVPGVEMPWWRNETFSEQITKTAFSGRGFHAGFFCF